MQGCTSRSGVIDTRLNVLSKDDFVRLVMLSVILGKAVKLFGDRTSEVLCDTWFSILMDFGLDVCLTGEGRGIVGSQVVAVELADGRTLKITILDMMKTGRIPNGKTIQLGGPYPYWLSCRDWETPFHSMRMLWIAWGKVVFGKVESRAYISVAAVCELRGTDHVD